MFKFVLFAALISPFSVFAGVVQIAGKKMQCAQARIVLDRRFDGPGALGNSLEYPDDLEMRLNPRILNQMPKKVRWFVFNHECGHAHIGANEKEADLWGVETSYKQGWFDREAVRQICEDFAGQPGDREHPPGNVRCNYITKRFQQLEAQKQGAHPNVDYDQAKEREAELRAQAERRQNQPQRTFPDFQESEE